ncbi:MAG: hypothetical protein NTY53_16965 [Kiritimatiellaeota bacterium]|nr:hypothetical protein [Kiritimatiellota bacterium]
MKQIVLLMLVLANAVVADELDKNFSTPPPSARPWVYWFPLSGNLTKEGIWIKECRKAKPISQGCSGASCSTTLAGKHNASASKST